MTANIRQVGSHRDDCEALELMASEGWSGPWLWNDAAENDPAGRVYVPCWDDNCPARLELDSRTLPGGRDAC
jgi:hypothetical protein